MTDAAALRSGKTHRNENFPVASRLLGAEQRVPIMAFYDFVRTADDVADHRGIPPTEKFALLDRLEAGLLGDPSGEPEGQALRGILLERGLDLRHAREMLVAFRQDVTRSRYRTWEELVGYCRYSAMPVGRFVLDVFHEPRSTWPASDALCTALQVINHLQDCGEDYRDLNRVYLPLETLDAHNARIEALGGKASDAGLRRSIDELCDRVRELLARSAGLSSDVQCVRLGLEIAVIQRLAERLLHILRVNDPLGGDVRLSIIGSAAFAILGAIRGSTTRMTDHTDLGWLRTRPADEAAPSEETSTLAEAASGSSFYSAMRILPRRRREAIFEIYGFCRAVDDVADDGGDRAQRKARLAQWRQRIDSIYAGRPDPQCARLAAAVADFGLKREDFLAVIDGMEMDVETDIRAPGAAVLDLYCERVASAVGRLCVRVFGLEEKDGALLSHHLGRALQLTNILRDLDEDGEFGRLYLPREVLHACGIETDDPARVLAHANLDAACRRIAAQAVTHYDAADDIMARAPRAAVRAPRIMGRAYRAMLDALTERGWHQPRQRVQLSRTRLAGIAVRSLVG